MQEKDDPYVVMAGRVSEIMNQAGPPGATLLDNFPSCRTLWTPNRPSLTSISQIYAKMIELFGAFPEIYSRIQRRYRQGQRATILSCKKRDSELI